MEFIGFYPDELYINGEKENLPDWNYSDNGDNTVTLTKYRGDTSYINIPSQIDGKTVSDIRIYYDNRLENAQIEEIVVPNTVKYIYISIYNTIGIMRFPNGINSNLDLTYTRI